ncbi:hypothetical protein NCS56_01402200 [Fusarium sp. Ph1]|nr:hypothetical protein NCS56_01402200 [Fusarium sp. Ph1]
MSQIFKRNLGKDAALDLDTSLDPNLVVERGETVVIGHLKPKRNISTLRIIAIGFNISNSWFAIATSLSVAIATGGTVSIIYGVLITFFLYACAALTLAELAAIYPTAGGQYHFSSILAPKKANKLISYACGMIAMSSWVAINASVNILGAQMITSLTQYFLNYLPHTWHVFLIYQAINVFTLGYNIFILNIFPFIHEFGFALTLATFVISTITSLACSEKQSSTYVWTNFESETGWPPVVSFLTGLITPSYIYAGLDAALHLAEETRRPEKVVSLALVSTIGIGFFTAFVFGVSMSYTITDLASLLNDPMPIYKLWRVATQSTGAATAFIIALLIISIVIIISIQQTSSRLIWAMACDNSVIFSKPPSKLSPSLGNIPMAALLLQGFLVFLCGCIYLGSSAAFNALVGSGILLQMISFAIPAVLLICSKRSSDILTLNWPFKLPSAVGWVANVVTVISALLQLGFFVLPPSILVTASSMTVVGIISLINWMIYARNHYQGPRIEFIEEGQPFSST